MRYEDLIINDRLIYGVPVHEETGEISDYNQFLIGHLLDYMRKYNLNKHDFINDKHELFMMELYKINNAYNYDLNFYGRRYDEYGEYTKLILEDEDTGDIFNIF